MTVVNKIKKIRIGTDRFFVVPIRNASGEDIDLTDKTNVAVYVRRQSSQERTDQKFAVNKSVISFQWDKSENIKLGYYDIVVEYDETNANSETGVAHQAADVVSAFCVVPYSEDEQNEDDSIIAIVNEIMKGNKGDAFTFDDFTEDQIADLKKPATEAIAECKEAAGSVNTSIKNCETAISNANTAADKAKTATDAAIKATDDAVSKANAAGAAADGAIASAKSANEATDKLNTALASVNNIDANTGVSEYPAFNASTAYAVGNIVLHNGLLRIFTAAHAAGAWSDTDNKVHSLKNEIDINNIIINPDSNELGTIVSGTGKYTGYGIIYKDTYTSKMMLTNVKLYTAYTGSAYIVIAKPSSDKTSCTITNLIAVSLTGSETDLTSEMIEIPVGYCVGICGVSTMTLRESLSTSNGSWYLSSVPSIGGVNTNNYGNPSDALLTLKSVSALKDAVSTIQEDVRELENKSENAQTMTDYAKFGDASSKGGEGGNSWTWIFNTKITKDVYITSIKTATSYTCTGYIIEAELSSDGSTYTILSSRRFTCTGYYTDISSLKYKITAGHYIGITFDDKSIIRWRALGGGYASYGSASLVNGRIPCASGFYIDAELQLKEIISVNTAINTAFGLVCNRNSACKCIIFGSSYTEGIYQPMGFAWMERLNDMIDVNLINFGQSGQSRLSNIRSAYNAASLRFGGNTNIKDANPQYMLFGNCANGTANGEDGYKELKEALYLTKSFGAKMIVADEERGDYAMLNRSFAKEFDLPYIRQAAVAIKCYPNANIYAGLKGEGHNGYRAIAPYIIRADVLKSLPINKSVKMFRVRPAYKSGSPSISDLNYDNNLERLRYWTAISCGSTSGGNPDTGEANTNDIFHSYTGLSNTAFIDNLDKVDGSYNPTDGVSSGTRKCEVGWMISGKAITFKNFALIEFIIDKVHITKGHFEIEMSSQPTAVYYACSRTSTASPVSLFTSISFNYTDGVLSADLSGNGIQQYDKIRIAIELSGEFTLANPVLSDYDGENKIIDSNIHCERKYGVELNPKTSVDSGWTLSGNVSVKSLPSVIADYTAYNTVKSHLEFTDNSAIASKSIPITQPCNKVAIRIACQSFMPIATTRYSSDTDIMSSGYVSTSNQIKNYDYDYGTIKLIINDNIVRKSIVMQGWSEVYFEIDVEPTATSLNVNISRNNFVDSSFMNSDRPLFVHDVSVQKIE